MLASSFWQEREREREREIERDFGTFFNGDSPNRMLLFNWEHPGVVDDRSHSVQDLALSFRTRDSLFLFLSPTSSWSFFLLWIFSQFSVNERLLFWLFSYWNSRNSLFFGFLIANSSEKVGPASLYKWKTVVPLVAPLSRHFGSSSERLEGFSFFKVQIFRPCSRSYF